MKVKFVADESVGVNGQLVQLVLADVVASNTTGCGLVESFYTRLFIHYRADTVMDK